MNVNEAIEYLRREQRVVSKSIGIFEELNLSDVSKHEFVGTNKKRLKLLTWRLKHWEVEKMKSKNGSMSAFIYGKPTGGSRYVGSKKKRKTTRINKSKKVVS